MESPLSHKLSPPRAHTSPGPTPGTISLTHGMIATVNQHNSLLSKLHKPTTYSSPPPVACNPDNNVCKVITYRGEKVAAFTVNGIELICLPQAFELFLKHLVGGLHTVYTKLKRLDITPVVCNVEQVRILRGLGAIQPGVNRCKLISCKEFDVLYDDCTNSSARPGRPPKRSPSIHASPETLEKLKKCRVDGDYPFDPRLYDRKAFLNGFAHHPYMGPLAPFMPMNPVNIMTPPVSLAMATHLGLRHEGSIIKDRSDSDLISPRIRDERMDSSIKGSHMTSPHYDSDRLRSLDYDNNKPLNLQVNGHAKDLSTKYHGKSDDDEDDDRFSDDQQDDLEDSLAGSDSLNGSDLGDKVAPQVSSFQSQLQNGEIPNISSIETLLLNIQGLLKVAAENARHHERQLSIEKTELKMELLREKEMREGLEKQLSEEQKNKALLLRRIKKEKRARRRLQEQMGGTQSEENKNIINDAASVTSQESDKHTPDTPNEKETEKENNSESERRSSDVPQERPSHLFENFINHNNNNNTRFPYMTPLKGEVQ